MHDKLDRMKRRRKLDTLVTTSGAVVDTEIALTRILHGDGHRNHGVSGSEIPHACDRHLAAFSIILINCQTLSMAKSPALGMP